MNLVDLLVDSGGRDSVAELGKKLNLSSEQTEALVKSVAPALTGGLRKQAESSGGIEGLARALSSGHHQKYIEQPERVGDDDMVNDGNKILGHLFGSKDVSRGVAAKAAESSGIDAGTIKKALPVLAGLAMGALSKKSDRGSGVGGLLPGLFAGDDGKFGLDDVLNIGRKFFR